MGFSPDQFPYFETFYPLTPLPLSQRERGRISIISGFDFPLLSSSSQSLSLIEDPAHLPTLDLHVDFLRAFCSRSILAYFRDILTMILIMKTIFFFRGWKHCESVIAPYFPTIYPGEAFSW